MFALQARSDFLKFFVVHGAFLELSDLLRVVHDDSRRAADDAGLPVTINRDRIPVLSAGCGDRVRTDRLPLARRVSKVRVGAKEKCAVSRPVTADPLSEPLPHRQLSEVVPVVKVKPIATQLDGLGGQRS